MANLQLVSNSFEIHYLHLSLLVCKLLLVSTGQYCSMMDISTCINTDQHIVHVRTHTGGTAQHVLLFQKEGYARP